MNSGSTKLYNVLMGNPGNNVSTNNSIGRTAGAANSSSDLFDFFKKRGKSIENALGTTGAAVASLGNDVAENIATSNLLADNKAKMNDVAKRYGYNTYHDVWDARDKAAAEGDQATLDLIDNTINPELQAQANENAKRADEKAAAYKDYRENDYISNKINQDRGKFAGSAINTLSTATDLTGITANPLGNAIQGGIEGVADELEQSGLENFDAERAAQNALIGATTGAVTGALNKGISNSLAKRGGNLFKGGNAITRGINNFNANTAVGRGLSTLATGAGRGAVSGAVGGATGAGLSAALNNQDVLGSAVEGAKRGLTQGAVAGGIMTGANMALDKTPGVGNFMRELNSTRANWDNSGNSFDERLTNTLNSGDSAVGNWINQGPDTPTTASDWAKKAGERVIEDINNSNLGNRIKDVSGETPEDIANMQVNRNDMLEDNGDTLKSALASEEQAKPTSDAVVSSKTAKATKLRNAAGLKLQEQYGTIDKPTAKATNAPETLQKIAEAGFTKPADVERMADAVTGSNGEVSKLVSNLVETAKPVNTFDGEVDGQTLNDYIDLSIQKHGLDGINEGKAVKSQISALMKSLPSHADGSITFEDTPADAFKMTQLLDSEAANYEGRSGMNYGTTTPDKLRAAQVIKDVSSLLKDRIYSTVDVQEALTPEVAQNLKAYSPNNKDWANYVDNEIMTANSVKDLRSAQAPWVRAKKIIDNGYMNSVTFGGRNGRVGSSIPLTKRGLVGAALDATVNSKPGLRAQAKVLNAAADFIEPSTEATTTDPTTTPVVDTPAQTQNAITPNTQSTTTLGNISGTPSTQLYNAIGRTEGELQRDQARTAQYLANATNMANTSSTQGNTLESLLIPNAGSTTSVYNAMQSGNTQSTSTQPQTAGSYFQPTGDYWTDILGRAMSMAMDANDADAFVSLYGMYQDAISQSQKSQGKDYSDVTNWNSADRTKLLSAQNAMDQIDQLENAYNNATGGNGGNLLQGWLRSRASDISGGNWDPSAANYNSLSQSVGMGIVKNLINLGVTEADAKRYLEYLPALTDTKEQAQQKLNTLRSIYQSQINNLYSAYNL